MLATRSLHLDKVNKYYEGGKINDGTLRSFYEKLPNLEKAVTEVEKAAGMSYPPIFFEPALKIVSYPAADFSNTAIYASTNIRQFGDGYRLCIDMSLPFMIYASEETLRACVAHEFLHYVFISLAIADRRLASLSGEVDAPETHIIFDETHTVQADEWLDSDELKGLVQKVFWPVIKDQALENSIKEKWLESGLPSMRISASENRVAVPLLELEKIPLDEKIIERAQMKR